MRAAIVVFPGINRERDMAIALRGVPQDTNPRMIWHQARPSLDGHRSRGAARGLQPWRLSPLRGHGGALSPIMRRCARPRRTRGGHVLGVCNGFQILAEAQLLPGALLRNAGLRFPLDGLPPAR